MSLHKLKSQTGIDLAEKLAWLRLIRSENIGPITFYQLIERYGSAARALEALPEMATRAGRTKPLFIPYPAVIEKEYEALRKAGGDIMIAAEQAYPLALSAIADAPPVLSYIGNPALLAKPSVAIVGARNASTSGRKFAATLARDLGAAGQIVTSGLARGIDTAAHEGALETGTIAVVAGGIDVVYPPENQKLYEAIAQTGLIIAESPFGQKPFAQSFPRRNRIVSGLSAGVVVVEATIRSGSLITARLAGEQGRDVYAVPGSPLDPRAAGPNHLIREGATLIRGADDILENVQNFSGYTPLKDSAPTGFDSEGIYSLHEDPLTGGIDYTDGRDAHDAILSALSFTPVPLDDLLRENGLPVPVAQGALLDLELAGKVQRLPGNRVVLLET